MLETDTTLEPTPPQAPPTDIDAALGSDRLVAVPGSSESHDNRMSAVTYRRYGSPDVLRLDRVERPSVDDDSVLVQVRAAAVNPYDWHFMRGEPYFMRLFIGLRSPKLDRLGADFAGRVQAVGRDVSGFSVGDAVFGVGAGTFAEYARIPAAQVALKPPGVPIEHAAALPLAGLTALQGLRDVARVEPGQRVLVVGAGGGVGHLAVQIAKALGAEVTGVCSAGKLGLVRSLGADCVIDYAKEDFRDGDTRYDVIFQLAGTLAPSRFLRALTPKGTLIQSSGDSTGRWLGPIGRAVRGAALSPLLRRKIGSVGTHRNRSDLETLAKFVDTGQVRPVIDRTYTLAEVPDAIRYLERGHARGKVIITMPERPGDDR